MPKLYHVYATDCFDEWLTQELLYVAETAEEAEAYASKEWEDVLKDHPANVAAYEITSINGYTIQLVKEK